MSPVHSLVSFYGQTIPCYTDRIKTKFRGKEGALIPHGYGRVHARQLRLQSPGFLLVMQHHSFLCLIYAINPLKVVMKFDLVPEYFVVGSA
jgi:hypothetical protein